MYSNTSPTDSASWQPLLQRMSNLHSKLSPAQRELLEVAILSGGTAACIAHQMQKSPSTIRNQIQNIRQRAIKAGYEADITWTRILIDAGIYFAYCAKMQSQTS